MPVLVGSGFNSADGQPPAERRAAGSAGAFGRTKGLKKKCLPFSQAKKRKSAVVLAVCVSGGHNSQGVVGAGGDGRLS